MEGDSKEGLVELEDGWWGVLWMWEEQPRGSC